MSPLHGSSDPNQVGLRSSDTYCVGTVPRTPQLRLPPSAFERSLSSRRFRVLGVGAARSSEAAGRSDRCTGPKSTVENRRAVEKLPLPKSAKIESRQVALQTTFSDKNRMRRSAAVWVCAGSASNGLFLPGSTVTTEHASPLHFLRLLRVCDQEKSRPSHRWRVPVALKRGGS